MPFTTITAQWQGIPGAPGYTKIRFLGELSSSQATAAADRLRNFFFAQAGLLPSTCSVNFAATAQVFDVAGVLIDEVALSPVPSAVIGTATGAYSGATGAVINWITGEISGGRRVRGRTFMVPLAAGYDTAGSLAAATITTITNAANALANGVPGIIVHQALGDGGGRESLITGATVPDRAAILRSRRD